jgi:hypothetical protein
MKTLALAAVAATIAAGSAFAHPINEPHVCGVDPDTVMEYPGYAGKQGVWYDRGDYFFGFETVRFLEPVEYKSWSRVEGITTHHRLYKDDCRVSEIEIVHTETVDQSMVAVESDERVPNAGLEIDRDRFPYGRLVASRRDGTLTWMNRGSSRTVDWTSDDDLEWRDVKNFANDKNDQLRGNLERDDVREIRQEIRDYMDDIDAANN